MRPMNIKLLQGSLLFLFLHESLSKKQSKHRNSDNSHSDYYFDNSRSSESSKNENSNDLWYISGKDTPGTEYQNYGDGFDYRDWVDEQDPDQMSERPAHSHDRGQHHSHEQHNSRFCQRCEMRCDRPHPPHSTNRDEPESSTTANAQTTEMPTLPPLPTLPSTPAPQQSTTTSSNQCPCYKPHGSDRCYAFNPKQQAMNFMEAMQNFRDTTCFDPQHSRLIGQDNYTDTAAGINNLKANKSKPDKSSGSSSVQSSATPCHQSPTCRRCMRAVLNKFAAAAESSDDIVARNQTLDMISETETEFELKHETATCQNMHEDPVNNLGNNTENMNKKLPPLPGGGRFKRQYYGTYGLSANVDCRYNKGSLLDDNSGYTGLCSLCWSWRTLPTGYIPRLVNEINCNTAENSCLSGYGTCRPRYSTMTVLYKSGSEYYESTTQVTVGCECQVLMSSPIYSWVTGNG